MKTETKGYSIISLSEFERKAWECGEEPFRDFDGYAEAVHSYNLLLSRQVTKEDFVRPFVQSHFEYENWQPLFIGEWESKKQKDITKRAIDMFMKVNQLGFLHFNPLHPTIKEFEQILIL